MKKFLLLFIVFALLTACGSQKALLVKRVTGLRFIGEYVLPDKTAFKETRVGGLSSVDYDPTDSLYYLISDDRSDHNPARYYTAKIFLSNNAIDSIRFQSVVFLKLKNDAFYPNKKEDSLRVPDPEGLRINRKTGKLVWTNEGERIVQTNDTVLQNPSVNTMSKEGLWKDSFALPANLHVSAKYQGPRRNGVFEGLAFANNFKTLFVSVEEPLYEDGPRAGTGDSTAWIRIIKYNVNTKKPLAQYAYQLDPVVKEPIPKGAFHINGVPDVLAINNHQLLITERSFSTGYETCNVRGYLVELSGAENVLSVASLAINPPTIPLQKKLLVNMDNLGINIYNIEGATLGPRLPNGHRSLLFVADDNFSENEKTQFLLFEVIE